MPLRLSLLLVHPLYVIPSETPMIKDNTAIIIGGGFSGLSAALEFARNGTQVTLLESDNELGGLAGSFDIGDTSLEKFYHHWFTNDYYITGLVRELGCEENILPRATKTGMYYRDQYYRLSSPLDVLRFNPLSLFNRIRLGLLVLQARRVHDWKSLEELSAEEWLIKLAGQEVYKVVWEPLLKGKFGPFSSDVSAVWFWNKLKLRGGSRGPKGAEVLAYYKGGFAALAQRLADEIKSYGGRIVTSCPVTGITSESNSITGVTTPHGHISANRVIATTALPIVADLLNGHVSSEYLDQLRTIRYLSNVCLVLQLDRSLSDTYWLNVNDPGFPYVGIIEHTNFEPTSTYNGSHIIYLSKYLPADDPMYNMDNDQLLQFSIPHIQRMFPYFKPDWIQNYHVWKARHSQPIVTKNYSRLIPSEDTPLKGFHICSMAQIYPEDRGTNYAIRNGKAIAKRILHIP